MSSADPARSSGRLLAALGVASAVPLALIVVLTFADVFARYVFSRPIKGSVEIIQYAMALVIFTALPLITRARGHVSVSLIDNLLRGPAKRLQMTVCDAVSLLALLLVAWRLAAQALMDMGNQTKTIVLGLPQAPLLWVMCAFAAMSAVLMLQLLAGSIAGRGTAAGSTPP